MRFFSLFVFFFLVSCSVAVDDLSEVPSNPTYEKDVLPYLADHCLLCHGSPSSRNAPKDFRLDRFEDTTTADGVIVLGAAKMAASLVGAVKSGFMPPEGGIGPNGKQMLENWLVTGAPR
jgi:hypothetical protein